VTLADERCVACTPGAPPVGESDAVALLRELPEWRVAVSDGVPHLRRVYTFPDFARALAFTNAVGALAEEHAHHPALTTEWGRVTVAWWTHTIRGLHRNDFVMAAKSDRVYRV
jgi:4a-hydroxytetrahydrobiopterin dehydratase